MWLHSSVGRASHRYRGGHGFESRRSLDFFRLLLSNCLNWKIYCDDHSSLWSTTAVQIYELFHIYFTSDSIMLEISASMTQLNTRVYAILETHSIKETGADIWRQRFHSVYENIRLRPSTRRRINGVFKFIHFGERFRIYAFTVSVFIVFVWTEGLNA